jgi:hypothetical protein
MLSEFLRFLTEKVKRALFIEQTEKEDISILSQSRGPAGAKKPFLEKKIVPRISSQRFYLSFLVSVSFFGLFLVTLPAISPLQIQQDFQWRKPLVGSVFGLVCFLGIIAVFFPSYCSTIFQVDSIENRDHAVLTKGDKAFHKTATILGLQIIHGHHPSCEGFTAHEFQFGGRTFCTACIGLLLGALLSIFGTTAYFYLGWNIGGNIGLFLLLGVSSISLGLFQYMFFDIQWRVFRLLLNSLFVFGAFLIIAGIDAAVNSLVLDFFAISLSIFWLITRIFLSKHIHKEICQTCGFKCEVYESEI